MFDFWAISIMSSTPISFVVATQKWVTSFDFLTRSRCNPKSVVSASFLVTLFGNRVLPTLACVMSKTFSCSMLQDLINLFRLQRFYLFHQKQKEAITNLTLKYSA